MLSILSDTEKAVVETMTMGLLPEPALKYLNDKGFDISRATYFRCKKKVEDKKTERMQYIAEHFQEMHLEKIDRLELIDKLMWTQFEKEQQPYRKVKILESIANLQPFLTSFYESTTIAIEVSKKFNPSNGDTKESPSFDEWFKKYGNKMHFGLIGNETDEELGKYYRDLQNEYNEYLKDWNWHSVPGLGEGPDPCKNSKVESSDWTKEDTKPPSIVIIPATTKEEPKAELVNTLSIQEAAPIVETTMPEEKEPEAEPKQKDTIDLDIAGRYPMPFDVVPWVQCKFEECNKWFKTHELRSKHITKYHVE